jgi:hypothetical protein
MSGFPLQLSNTGVLSQREQIKPIPKADSKPSALVTGPTRQKY